MLTLTSFVHPYETEAARIACVQETCELNRALDVASSPQSDHVSPVKSKLENLDAMNKKYLSRTLCPVSPLLVQI